MESTGLGCDGFFNDPSCYYIETAPNYSDIDFNWTHATTSMANSSTCPADRLQFDFILYEIIVPILFGLTTFLGVIGNCLVIYVIISKERMRTVTYLLLLNLAVVDLLFILVIPSVTAYVFATQRWPFGDAACKLMHYVVNVTAYVSVYTLVLVSMVRYMTIVHNAPTARLRSRRSIVVLIGVIWAVMLGVNTPVLYTYAVKRPVDEGEMDACVHKSIEEAQRLFLTFFVFAYVLPLGVIAVFSVCILRHIAKHRSQAVSAKRSRSADKKKRAGLLLMLVVVVFAVLWLPIHIHLLVALFVGIPDEPWYSAVSVLWNCLAYSNSWVNPIIYNHASKDFRDAFREAACCGRRAGRRRGVAAADGRAEERTEGMSVGGVGQGGSKGLQRDCEVDGGGEVCHANVERLALCEI